MLFRFVFAAAMVMLSLNISVIFSIDKANPLEKGLILAAAVVIAMRGRIEHTLVPGCAIIIGATLLSAVATGYENFSWDIYMRSLVTFVTLLLFLAVIPREDDRDWVLIVLAFTPLLQVVLGVAYAALGIKPMFRPDSFGVMRMQGSTGTAFLGAATATGAVAAMAYAHLKDMRYLALVAINAGILLLSGARMATAAAVIGCAGLLFFGFRRDPHARYLIMIGGSLAAMVAVPVLGGALLERVGSGSLQGRDLLWNFLGGFVRDYPEFGVGLGHQYTLIPASLTQATGTVAAHNEYLRLLVELGRVGILVLGLGTIALLAAALLSPTRRTPAALVVILLAFFTYTSTDNTLSRFECAAMLVVALYGNRWALGEWRRTKIAESLADADAARDGRPAPPAYG
jgi:hypothetical protein